jgi:hypothetical protein
MWKWRQALSLLAFELYQVPPVQMKVRRVFAAGTEDVQRVDGCLHIIIGKPRLPQDITPQATYSTRTSIYGVWAEGCKKRILSDMHNMSVTMLIFPP